MTHAQGFWIPLSKPFFIKTFLLNRFKSTHFRLYRKSACELNFETSRDRWISSSDGYCDIVDLDWGSDTLRIVSIQRRSVHASIEASGNSWDRGLVRRFMLSAHSSLLFHVLQFYHPLRVEWGNLVWLFIIMYNPVILLTFSLKQWSQQTERNIRELENISKVSANV